MQSNSKVNGNGTNGQLVDGGPLGTNARHQWYPSAVGIGRAVASHFSRVPLCWSNGPPFRTRRRYALLWANLITWTGLDSIEWRNAASVLALVRPPRSASGDVVMMRWGWLKRFASVADEDSLVILKSGVCVLYGGGSEIL